MANICTFTLRVYGTRPQRNAVAQYVMSRVETHDGSYFITSEGEWAELQGEDVESLCQQSHEASELSIQGISNHVPGLYLAKELSTTFPDLKIQVDGADEDGNEELWELNRGESRLLALHGMLMFRELGVWSGLLGREGWTEHLVGTEAGLDRRGNCENRIVWRRRIRR